MSFNSILAMAGVDSPGEGSTAPRPSTQIRPAPSANGGNLNVVKRKAEGSLEQPAVKIQRQDQTQIRYTGTAAPKTTSSLQGKPTSTPTKQVGPRPLSSKSETSSNEKKPIQSNDKTSLPKNAARPPPLSGPAPVKGSFQDIINRAKAIQETKLAKDRKFVNKATEVRKKEDRKKLVAKQKTKSKSAPTSRSGSTEPSAPTKKSSNGAIREKPKPEPIAYKGTARPSAPAPAYKGTANLHSKQVQKSSSGKDRYDSNRYGYHSDLRGRYDEEDEEDYDSEEGYESSDMEAGILDIDEEEELALRQARKEDAEALRLENDLKRQKMLRKKELAGRR